MWPRIKQSPAFTTSEPGASGRPVAKSAPLTTANYGRAQAVFAYLKTMQFKRV
jgi:hypothetical protein